MAKESKDKSEGNNMLEEIQADVKIIKETLLGALGANGRKGLVEKVRSLEKSRKILASTLLFLLCTMISIFVKIIILGG